MERISVNSPPSISTFSWNRSDAMGLLGILLALGLLVWLAYRGWSVLLLAPAAALIAAAISREPLLAHWTQTFMGSAAQFLAQFFPLFLLGALFGKLMDDSGSVEAIARFMTERLGPGRAILAVVLAGALVTYGGVSLFVAFFVLAPMAQALFQAADIPRRLMPAAIALGTSTFTMTAFPGTPAIQNAIPMPFFGTTPFAAPGLGIIASAIMLGFGLWWLARSEAAARRAGEGYGGGTDIVPRSVADDQIIRERATTAHEFDPAEIGRGRHGTTPVPIGIAVLPLVVVVSVNLLMSLVILPRLDFSFLGGGELGRHLAVSRCRCLVGGGGTRDRNPSACPFQSSAVAGLAREHGCWRQRLRLAGVQRGEPGGIRRRRRDAARVCRGARLGSFNWRRAVGLACGGNQHTRRPDRLGLGWHDDRARCARRDLYAHRSRTRHKSRVDAPGGYNWVWYPRQLAA
jgi:hypothetical protein